MTTRQGPDLEAVAAKRHRMLTVRAAGEDEPRQRPLEFRLIQRLLEFTRPYAAKRNWLALLVVIRSIQLPALTWVLAATINGPIQRGDVRGVVWSALGFAALAVSTQVVMHYRQRLALELGEAVVFDLRNRMFEHIQRMPMSWFQRTKVGHVISRVSSDVEEVRIGVQDVLFVSLVQLGQMLVAAAAMLWYDARLFLLVLALAPVVWLINNAFQRRLSASLRAMRESFSRVVATLAESVIGIRVTQGFVRQDENARMFHDLAEDHSTYNTAVMRTQGLFVPLLELNSQIFIAVLLLVGGYRVLVIGGTSVGELVGFFFMANLFFSPISVLGNQYNQALTAMAGAERVFRLLDTPPEWSDPPDAIDLPPIEGHVEFDQVTFGYSPDRPVLHGVSFRAEPGQTIALVGPTGSGKTTIINLVSKFYLPLAGAVRIDGHDLRRVSGQSLHRQMGIVLQQNFLFDGSVADNIRVGKPDASDEQVIAAVRRLDCLDLLAELPDGFQSRVGERGVTVSAGQRQLICFARALLADPRILILDEATSSIDTQTEFRLQAALSILLRGRTSFVVAHRLSTIRNADQVLVLDHGRVVEHGTHAELLSAVGTYAALYRQFARVA
ncbi:MAG: ABC transporter ATP-binding protein [Pirellulaceae bacterium]|nr:ABC transporter ATP-binding protein [Pirellulaceae bacterium]